MLEVKEGNNVFQIDCPSFRELQHAYNSFLKERTRNRLKASQKYARLKQEREKAKEKAKAEIKID
jgi:hypothetical protein